MSFSNQIVEMSLEECSVITYGLQIRRAVEGAAHNNNMEDQEETALPSTEAAVTPGDPNSPIRMGKEEVAAATTRSSSVILPYTRHISSPTRGPYKCIDCCTSLLLFIVLLPLLAFIPALVLQRTTSGAEEISGGDGIEGYSSNGFNFEVSGSWTAALSPLIVVLCLAGIALMKVCCCGVCCGAGGSREDTDAIASAAGGGYNVATPMAIRVFPAFDTLREQLRGNITSSSDEVQQLPSESSIATSMHSSLMRTGGRAGAIDACAARRKVFGLIWLIAIVQFIVLCVRLHDTEDERKIAVSAAIQAIATPTGNTTSASEFITAGRMACGLGTLSTSINANTSLADPSTLIDESSVNGLASVTYTARTWTATFIPTMIIMALILVDQLVLVDNAYIARLDFTKGTPSSEQEEEMSSSSTLMGHAHILVRLIDVIAAALSLALFLCRMDEKYPFNCGGPIDSNPWRAVLLPLIISLFINCFVALGRGAWLSYRTKGSYSLSTDTENDDDQLIPHPVSINAATTGDQEATSGYTSNVLTAISACDHVRKRMIRRAYYDITKDALICLATLTYIVLLALALDGKTHLRTTTTTQTGIYDVVQNSLMAAVTPLQVSASQWHILNIPLYVVVAIGFVTLGIRLLFPYSKLG